MNRIFLILGMIVTLLSCQQNNNASSAILDPGVHKGIALETINTSKYTYLLMNENGTENWVAFPTAAVTIGETYYYANEMLMTNFESKELGRTFDRVFFIDGVHTEPPVKVMDQTAVGNSEYANPQPVEQGNPMPAAEVQSNNAMPMAQDPNLHKGVALEKLNAMQYTYLLVNENGTEKWLAFPKAEVKIGETYYYGNEMLMTNFESKDLKRTFEKVYFVEGVTTQQSHSGNMAQPQENPHATGKVTAVEKADVNIAPAKGGLSIADLFARKAQLVGKRVIVKGKVTKYNEAIMNSNWIHIQDGSSYKGSYDLTISSQKAVKVGETYTFEGTVVTNKDFGAGYKYDVLLENAVIK